MTSSGTEKTRQDLFDAYWRTREYVSADARTRQRAVLAARMMRHDTGRLLDVGCGRGLVSAYFVGRGYDVLGIDISPLSVEWTRRCGGEAQILDLETSSINGTYDTILCLETLQYLRDPVGALVKLRNALLPEGEMIVSLPCEYHLVRRLSILFSGKGPGGIDFPLTVLYPAEHRRLFARAGLAVSESYPVSLIPPRWGVLVGLGQLPVRLAPSLFALSIIYRVVPEER